MAKPISLKRKKVRQESQKAKLEALRDGRISDIDRQNEAIDHGVSALPLPDEVHLPADPVTGAFTWYSWLVPRIQMLVKKESAAKFGDNHENAKWVWPMLKDARLFAIPQPTYVALHKWADAFTTEMADLPYLPSLDDAEVQTTPEQAVHYNNTVTEAGMRVPYPENLPFENTLFMYGTGLRLSDEQMVMHVGDRETIERAQLDYQNLIGHLVSHNGTIVEFIVGTRTDGQGALFYHPVHDNEEGWYNPLTLNPWKLPGLVGLVNSFKTLIHEQPHSFSAKRSWEKAQKYQMTAFGLPRRPPPKPFYRVELHHDLVEDWARQHSKAQKARASWKLGHRHDVRGHERVRVMRGEHPIDPKLEKDLLKRGYRLYLDLMPSSEDPTWRLLAERHEKPKAQNEWLAVKVSWIDQFIRGPENAPYIPAIRTIPSNMEAP